jgi:hypothetical protein
VAGAGTNLHRLIEEWTGETFTASCSCKTWMKKMDRDLRWASAHRQLIVRKLRDEALKRKRKWKVSQNRQWWEVALDIPGSTMVLRQFLRMMVDKAIAEAT